MKRITRFVLAICALGLLLPASGRAQEKPIDLTDFKDVKIATQKTPDFNLKGGTKDKRWTAKDWIEIEPEFRVKAPPGSKDLKVFPSLTLNYYVFLNSPKKENQRVLTAEIVHTSVPVGEVVHSVAYISPSTILRLTEKPEGNPNLITFVGVEVVFDGKVIGQYTKGAKGKWWEAPTAPAKEADLRNKMQTPFAPLWGDFHLDVQPK